MKDGFNILTRCLKKKKNKPYKKAKLLKIASKVERNSLQNLRQPGRFHVYFKRHQGAFFF